MAASVPSNATSFPMDFFEHCQQTNDVEFGGSDVLHVYNSQQVKHRLNTAGMYVASTKVGVLDICFQFVLSGLVRISSYWKLI